MYTLLVESVFRGYHKYKDSWPEGSNLLLLQLGNRYFKIDIFAPEFAPPSLFMHLQTFYPEVKSFTKMEINLVG